MERTRTVTVLVADVVGSTELFARLGEDAADVARRAVFGAFGEAVAEGSGDLVKTMGDGCLASFGSAADAVTAAVALQQRVAALRDRSVPGLGLRVGLAVGDVTEEQGDVFGPAVVTASRLCDAAGEHQILASEVVRVLAGTRGGHRYEAAGDLILKGIAEPVAACTVVVDVPTETRSFPAASRPRRRCSPSSTPTLASWASSGRASTASAPSIATAACSTTCSGATTRRWPHSTLRSPSSEPSTVRS